MNFGSKYVLDNDKLEFEYVSDEEYEEGISVSDSSDEDDVSPPPRVLPPPPVRRGDRGGSRSGILGKVLGRKKKERKLHHWQREAEKEEKKPSSSNRKFQKADTNVVSITLNKLQDPSNMHAGDSITCQADNCPVVMSNNSKVTTETTGKIWKCEFCGYNNEVDVEDGEIPTDSDVKFLLEAAPLTQSAGPSGIDEALVIFCIDISGSMCITTEVPGHVNIRGSSAMERLRGFNITGESQYLPNQRRDVTNISRLQSMQAAVDKQLEDLVKNHPNRRVAVIAFNNELRFIDEGVNTDRVVAGEKLNNMAELERLSAELPLPKPIKETRRKLSDKIFDLEAGGGTALGPSIVLAMGLASQYAGSKIILCTDGLANKGLGKLESGSLEEQAKFYEEMAEKAVEKGVSVSVITIEGTASKLVQLGKLADRTGGQVNHVDPLKLTEEFSNILADRIIATNVMATFILHRNLVFIDEDTDNNVVVRNIGNVRADTEIAFRYGKKTIVTQSSKASKDKDMKKEAQPLAGVPEQGPSTSQLYTNASDSSTLPTELPFQLQIQYTDTNGTKALRVLTEKREVTKNREEAEKHLNIEVIGPYAAKQTADLALKGEYTASRGVALMHHRLGWRNAQSTNESEVRRKFNKVFGKIKKVDNHVQSKQKTEMLNFGRNLSDDEDEAYDEVDEAPKFLKESCTIRPAKKMHAKKKSKRNEEMHDEMANDVFRFKNLTHDSYFM